MSSRLPLVRRAGLGLALLCILAACGGASRPDAGGAGLPPGPAPTAATSPVPPPPDTSIAAAPTTAVAESTVPTTSAPPPTTAWDPRHQAVVVDGPTDTDPLLGAHPAFLEPELGITPVDCVLPGFAVEVDAIAAYYQAAIDCHHQSWLPTFERVGLALESPSLWAGAESVAYDGACGSNSTGREAFYCPGDRTIVMPFDSMRTIADHGEGYALAVLSHEYGHHIQEQFGILRAYGLRRQGEGWESEAGQRLSRQLELQAWCLSGMFYGVNTGRGSVTQELSDQAHHNNSHAGDRPGELREHGLNENIGIWFGWGRHPSVDPADPVVPALYECNPWAARSPETLE